MLRTCTADEWREHRLLMGYDVARERPRELPWWQVVDVSTPHEAVCRECGESFVTEMLDPTLCPACRADLHSLAGKASALVRSQWQSWREPLPLRGRAMRVPGRR